MNTSDFNNKSITCVRPSTGKEKRLLCEYLILNYFVGFIFAPSATPENLEKKPQSVSFSASRADILNHLETMLGENSGVRDVTMFVDEILTAGILRPINYIAERGSPLRGFAEPFWASTRCLATNYPFGSKTTETFHPDSVVEENERIDKEKQQQQKNKKKNKDGNTNGSSGNDDANNDRYNRLVWNPWRRNVAFTQQSLGLPQKEKDDQQTNSNNHCRSGRHYQQQQRSPRDDYGPFHFVPLDLRPQIHLLNGDLVQKFFSFVRQQISCADQKIDPRSIFSITQVSPVCYSENGRKNKNNNNNNLRPDLQRYYQRLKTMFVDTKSKMTAETSSLMKFSKIKQELLRFDPKCNEENVIEALIKAGKLIRFRCTNPDTDYVRNSPLSESYSFNDGPITMPVAVGHRICDHVTPISRLYFNADVLRVVGYSTAITHMEFQHSMVALGWENSRMNSVLTKDLEPWKVAFNFEFELHGNRMPRIASSVGSAIDCLLGARLTPQIEDEIARLRSLFQRSKGGNNNNNKNNKTGSDNKRTTSHHHHHQSYLDREAAQQSSGESSSTNNTINNNDNTNNKFNAPAGWVKLGGQNQTQQQQPQQHHESQRRAREEDDFDHDDDKKQIAEEEIVGDGDFFDSIFEQNDEPSDNKTSSDDNKTSSDSINNNTTTVGFVAPPSQQQFHQPAAVVPVFLPRPVVVGIPPGGSCLCIPPPALIRGGAIVQRDFSKRPSAIISCPPPFTIVPVVSSYQQQQYP